MDKNPFALEPEQLPDTLPIFPLTGVLLMPFGELPLNIFEPRYVAMVNDALATHRMIGMIQPCNNEAGAALYEVGCAGKITDFSETADGRYLITLSGIIRFRISRELNVESSYRQVEPNWSDFKGDSTRKKCLNIDRDKLKALLSAYFEKEEMSCDFEKFKDVEDGKLITCLSMVCPFEPAEKQALLEQDSCAGRAELFMNMLEMAVKSGVPPDMSYKNCH